MGMMMGNKLMVVWYEFGECEEWGLVGMKGGHAHKNSCMLGMNEKKFVGE